MKANRLGMLSALLASVCCVGPVLLVLLGLGSLGFGALIGQYHWWFIFGAVILLGIAWRSFLSEASRCKTAKCEMKQGKTTRTALILASAIVVLFFGMNFYTYAAQRYPANIEIATGERIKIPVQGMTCFTCELAVESALKGLPGVESVDARVVENAAYVNYDSSRVRIDDLIEAINKTGYKATRPSKRGDTE